MKINWKYVGEKFTLNQSEWYGRLMIVIQTQQWRNRIEKLLDVINYNGFEIIGEVKIKGEFTFTE